MKYEYITDDIKTDEKGKIYSLCLWAPGAPRWIGNCPTTMALYDNRKEVLVAAEELMDHVHEGMTVLVYEASYDGNMMDQEKEIFSKTR